VPVVDFIFQGLSEATHLEGVRWVLACPRLTRALLTVAFANKSGIDLLANELDRHAGRTTAFVGIRNAITSRQGLEALLDFGVTTYVVDTGARGVLFHPKVFLALGKEEARLLIGSANLTGGGLSNNIEAGLRIGLDLQDRRDRTLAETIAAQFDAMPGTHPENIFQVFGGGDLTHLQESGRLLDESFVRAPHTATTAATPAADTVPKIALARPPRRPKLQRPAAVPVVPAPVIAGIASPVSVAWEQVWASKPLTDRDLQIPQGRNTNRTGSINLDKGLLPDGIDFRHYFRDELFSGLTWVPTRATVDVAEADFQLVIKGINYGQARLRIAHTTSATSKAYKQGNAMTRLSWGRLRQFIAQPTLLGRTLTLYRDGQNPTKFLIEID